MARGGVRAGSGRPKGAANIRTREIADGAARDGLTPLEYMLKVMLNNKADVARRDDMAKAAAPYIHPRLATVQHQGDQDSPVVLKVIERVIVRAKD